ncbi:MULTISPECIES: hypothetical protein [Glutamicibacter]|uniref:Uncharacterized protein n=1 Tax=Glutamicibacter halophytocola TaxID=1933880 RepID=A0AA94XR06_9MICC|nr:MULTISPECIES: hypothetical protein [Glutamicibacter]ALG30416.1 hypothetical protein AOZ07_16470 [Glutamicibacter halophytocola]MBF6670405.1 hypothetical protein [Glutamicibacter sp. FBE19]UUX58791.1 hypothetical protein NUH22_16105 [Glutamicibacter halophytocola]
MPRRRIEVSVSHDEFEDLNNALEDHRNGFTDMAAEASNGLGLEPEYWAGRANEVQSLLEKVHEHSREETAAADGSNRTRGSGHRADREAQQDPRD